MQSLRNAAAAAFLVLLCLAPPKARAEADSFFLGSGRDGALTVTTSRVVNSYAPIAAPLAPGDIQVPIGAVRGGSFASGDLVMLWQTTGLIPEPASGMTGPFDVGTGAVGH